MQMLSARQWTDAAVEHILQENYIQPDMEKIIAQPHYYSVAVAGFRHPFEMNEIESGC
jgi:hypothetical protein